MLIVDRSLQILTVLLVVGSGWLLGMAQQNPGLAALAAGAALAAFALNDALGWVRCNRWIANLAAVGVTVYSLWNFLDVPSTDQLLLIANLLVYLQIVLLFQRKTPRVYWQILVLSLLQIVVAAAFNLSLEGGIIFFAYLLFNGVAMVLLQVHTHTSQIRQSNRRAAQQIAALSPLSSGSVVAMFDQVCPSRRPLRAMVRHVASLGIVAIGFATVIFFFIPRDQQSWSGPPIVRFQKPGSSRSINLEEYDNIYLSNQPVFRARFVNPSNGRNVELAEEPYFRGMPLPNLVIRNGQTRWVAPYDRVYSDDYAPLQWTWTRDYLLQWIALEPSPDPLLYTAMPAMRTRSTSGELEWSRQLSLLTRSPSEMPALTGSFEYEVAVPVLETNHIPEAYQYHGLDAPSTLPLEENPGEFKWYTALDSARYPGLVRLAGTVAATAPRPANHLSVARTLTDYLAERGGYSYTLNFRSIAWDPELDHIEDFTVRLKRGHCELYASALTLMLRSEGIPARMVVGYRGGEFHQADGSYRVLQRHAHAWVEAYIRREDCPYRWLATNQAGPIGVWLRLDPTPAGDDASIREALTPLDRAKDFWQSYVMGLDSEKQANSVLQEFVKNPFRSLGTYLTAEYWQGEWAKLDSPRWHASMIFRLGVALAAVVAISAALHGWWGRARRSTRFGPRRTTRPLFQRMLGRAIAIVAPRLGRWVAGDPPPAGREVPFYQRFVRLMNRHGMSRRGEQTPREFGRAIVADWSGRVPSDQLAPPIEAVVDAFYQVRFGPYELSGEESRRVDQSLTALEQLFAAAPALNPPTR